MNRRTFNTILGGGAMTLAAEAWPKDKAPANPPNVDTQSPPLKWPDGAYRRLLVDTHVPDWDPHLLADFDAARSNSRRDPMMNRILDQRLQNQRRNHAIPYVLVD